MDRLIRVDPSNVVQITMEPGQKPSGHVTLRNVMYTMPVAFRLQPLIKTRYTVKPQSGIISPLSTVTLEITYHLPQGSTLPHSFPHSGDTFLLHSVVVPGAAIRAGESSSMPDSVPADWFTTKKKQVFVDTGIKTVFVGSIVLTHLVRNGSMEEIREVLERSETKAVDSVDQHQDGEETLLHLAISRARPDIVQMLLEFGPDVEARNGYGWTPLEAACDSGEALIAELLLARKASTERSDSSTWGPIHLAARRGHVEVLRLLLLKGARVDSLARDGNTALHLAVEENRKDCVKLLLANGARTDIRNGRDGDTALHVAAVTGDEGVVKLLLKNGANKDVRNGRGKTAYDVAEENGHVAVYDALRYGDGLCAAARRGEVREIQRLLEGGATINGRDQNGWTALHRACFKGKVEAVRALLERGIDVEARDGEGYTALHCAVEAGHADVAEVVVKKGANVEARSNKGVSPLQVAEWMGYVGIVRILENGGAVREGSVGEAEKRHVVIPFGGRRVRKMKAGSSREHRPYFDPASTPLAVLNFD